MNDLGLAQALADQIEMLFRGGDPLRRFLLERVKDIQHVLETNRVNGAISVAANALANLENAAAKSLQRLRADWMVAELRLKKRLPDFPPDNRRKRLQIAPAGSDKNGWLDPAVQLIHVAIVVLL